MERYHDRHLVEDVGHVGAVASPLELTVGLRRDCSVIRHVHAEIDTAQRLRLGQVLPGELIPVCWRRGRLVAEIIQSETRLTWSFLDHEEPAWLVERRIRIALHDARNPIQAAETPAG